jgi:hypothetical protein
MTVNRIELIGLSVLVLTATATAVPAQNTSNPMLSGNTTNPYLGGNSTLLSGLSELSAPPALPNTLLQPNLGRNSITGLPCTGVGLLSVTPTLPGATAAPGATGTAVSTPSSAASTIQQLPSFPSVFSPTAAC